MRTLFWLEPLHLYYRKLGIPLIILLSIIPAGMWFVAKPISLRFVSSMTTLTSLGQLSALVGMALFSLALILSGRFKLLDQLFGGIDKMYTTHRWTGVVAFILLLFHPLFLALRLVSISVTSAAQFLLPSNDWVNNFGIFSLWLFIVIITTTLFARYRYQVLKFVHSFFGVSFFLGGVHSLLVSSDISRYMALRYYLLVLMGLGMSVYVYRSLLGVWLVRKKKYSVLSVEHVSSNVIEIIMQPIHARLQYSPGQCVFVSFHGSDMVTREAHPFSISSEPQNDELRITVKSLGDYTSLLKNLTPGTLARIEGPYGSFAKPTNITNKQIWIAGGIGVTPFVSMTRALKQEKAHTNDIDFYYSTKTKEEMVFIDELQDIADHNPRIRLIPFASNECGHLSVEKIIKMSDGVSGKEIFICGPYTMMQALKKQFLQLRIPRCHLHLEDFQLL